MASDGGYSFRDNVLGPGRGAINSRSSLDAALYQTRQKIVLGGDKGVPSLSTVCKARFANNYGDEAAINSLNPDLRLAVPSLLDAVAYCLEPNKTEDELAFMKVEKLRRKPKGFLPFRIWLAFSQIFNLDMPMNRRTYRGLALDDVEELNMLSTCNALSIEEYYSETPLSPLDPHPTFFLALLDLSNSKFSDGDVHKLNRPLSPFLAALKLDWTSVTDSGLQNLVISAMNESEEQGDQGRYSRLEILSLVGLKKVTDTSAKKVRFLSGLRMLDLRQTSATEAYLTILNQRPSSLPKFDLPTWRRSKFLTSRDITIAKGEPFLFSPYHSLSYILTSLRRLAAFVNGQHDSLDALVAQKQICVQISDAIRTPRVWQGNSNATSEELYEREIANAQSRGRGRAAYNAAYGTVTSTASIDMGTLTTDGSEYTDKGAAFRIRNEAKAAGSYSGPLAKKITLYESGQKKVTITPEGERERDDAVLSDWGEDGLEEDQRRDELERERIENLPEMYKAEAREKDQKRRDRRDRPMPEKLSPLTLVRHLPLKVPYGPRPLSEEEKKVREREREVKPVAKEETTVLREGQSLKKRKVEHGSSLDSFLPSTSRSTSSSSSPRHLTPSAFSTPRPSTPATLGRKTPPSSYLKPSSAGTTPLGNSANRTGLSKLGNVGTETKPVIKKRSSLSVFRKPF